MFFVVFLIFFSVFSYLTMEKKSEKRQKTSIFKINKFVHFHLADQAMEKGFRQKKHAVGCSADKVLLNGFIYKLFWPRATKKVRNGTKNVLGTELWCWIEFCGLVWPCSMIFLYGVLQPCVVLLFEVLWPYIAFSRGHRSKFIWSCWDSEKLSNASESPVSWPVSKQTVSLEILQFKLHIYGVINDIVIVLHHCKKSNIWEYQNCWMS